MATPDIEDVRRLARELERKEQRGGGGFAFFPKAAWSAIREKSDVVSDSQASLFGFIRDDYQGFKERTINGLSVLAAFAMMVSAYSKGTDPVGAAVISFIVYIIARGVSVVGFVLLELAVENWGWALVIGLFLLVTVFG